MLSKENLSIQLLTVTKPHYWEHILCRGGGGLKMEQQKESGYQVIRYIVGFPFTGSDVILCYL